MRRRIAAPDAASRGGVAAHRPGGTEQCRPPRRRDRRAGAGGDRGLQSGARGRRQWRGLRTVEIKRRQLRPGLDARTGPDHRRRAGDRFAPQDGTRIRVRVPLPSAPARERTGEVRNLTEPRDPRPHPGDARGRPRPGPGSRHAGHHGARHRDRGRGRHGRGGAPGRPERPAGCPPGGHRPARDGRGPAGARAGAATARDADRDAHRLDFGPPPARRDAQRRDRLPDQGHQPRGAAERRPRRLRRRPGDGPAPRRSPDQAGSWRRRGMPRLPTTRSSRP